MADTLQSGHVPQPAAWWAPALDALAQAWDEVPRWAKSPLAIGLLCAFLVVTFLGSLALVVNGVVERSEARQRDAALQAQARLVPHKRPYASAGGADGLALVSLR